MDYLDDARAVNVRGGQWSPAVKSARADAGRPALEFSEFHTYVQRLVNAARKNRPQAKISPGDSRAIELVSEFLESRLRHIQYASQADVAYDGAVECAATGGFGFYEVTCEYTDAGTGSIQDKPTFNQEPRIKRILDPMTEYPDPNCVEPDFSDAMYWFSRFWMDRKDFEKEYGVDPIPFDSDAISDEDWNREDRVCCAKYWHVEIKKRQYIALADGTTGYIDELYAMDPMTGLPMLDEAGNQVPRDIADDEIVNSRMVDVRTVHCDTIDGEKVLRREQWKGNWIPKIPVLGREVVVDGKRHLISVVRFAQDAQKLKNAYLSGIADSIQTATLAPWIGPVDGFVGDGWKDAQIKKYDKLTYRAYDENGKPLPAPTRNVWEAPIQALAQAATMVSDDIRRSVGYTDPSIAASEGPVSGVAVTRRTQQAELTNFHFEDNLIRSQYHCARIVLDLDRKLTDTPRVLKGRQQDGTTISVPVTVKPSDEEWGSDFVPGMENVQHLPYDVGRYDIVITSGPSFDTKRDEEKAFISGLPIMQDPNMFAAFGPAFFRLCGFPDLEEIAKAMAPPQIQALLNGGANQPQVPPQIQQQLAAQSQQIQQLGNMVQGLLMEKKAKITETEGRIAVEQAKAQGQLQIEQYRTAGKITTQANDHIHDATKAMFEAELNAVDASLNQLNRQQSAFNQPTVPFQPVKGIQ